MRRSANHMGMHQIAPRSLMHLLPSQFSLLLNIVIVLRVGSDAALRYRVSVNALRQSGHLHKDCRH
jgi:hypothetical protein